MRPKNTIGVYSYSKYFGCTGWRLGAIALLLAYPMGYYIGAVANPRYQGMLLMMVLIPFWTSYIIRTYAWIGILQSNGFLDSALGWVPGLPTDLLYSRTALMIGFVHVFLPIMILLMLPGVLLTTMGGQLTLMVVDCLEGIISLVFYLCVAVALTAPAGAV